MKNVSGVVQHIMDRMKASSNFEIGGEFEKSGAKAAFLTASIYPDLIS